MSTQNMTLLSQDEIDILLSFLLHQKNTVSTNVLDQANIDKLISIIKNSESSQLNVFFHSHLINNTLEKNLNDFQLLFQINSETDFVELFAVNVITKEEIELTPACLSVNYEKNVSSTWGYSLSPILFYNIISHLKLKSTTAIYSALCKRFALKQFGDENYSIPIIYLPPSEELKKYIID